MNTLNINLNNVSKSIHHAMLNGKDRSEKWFRDVQPKVMEVTNAYRELARNTFLEGMLGEGKLDLKPLVKTYMGVEKWFLSMVQATGYDGVMSYMPSFLELPRLETWGMDVPPQDRYEHIGSRQDLLDYVSRYNDEDMKRILVSLDKKTMIQWAETANKELIERLRMVKVYRFDIEEEKIKSESAAHDIYERAVKKAEDTKRPKPAALNALNKVEGRSPMVVQGGFQALSSLLMSYFAVKQAVSNKYLHQSQRNAEGDYVWHTGGVSHLIQRKDGERPDSSSGKNSTSDVIKLRQDVDEANYDELRSCLEDMDAILAPIHKHVGRLKVYWSDTEELDVTKLDQAFEKKVYDMEQFFQELDRKGERDQEVLQSQRFKQAKEIEHLYEAKMAEREAELLA